MIRQLCHRITRYLACRKLKKITRERRDSYEVRRYRERRAAALKGLALKRMREERVG